MARRSSNDLAPAQLKHPAVPEVCNHDNRSAGPQPRKGRPRVLGRTDPSRQRSASAPRRRTEPSGPVRWHRRRADSAGSRKSPPARMSQRGPWAPPATRPRRARDRRAAACSCCRRHRRQSPRPAAVRWWARLRPSQSRVWLTSIGQLPPQAKPSTADLRTDGVAVRVTRQKLRSPGGAAHRRTPFAPTHTVRQPARGTLTVMIPATCHLSPLLLSALATWRDARDARDAPRRACRNAPSSRASWTCERAKSWSG